MGGVISTAWLFLVVLISCTIISCIVIHVVRYIFLSVSDNVYPFPTFSKFSFHLSVSLYFPVSDFIYQNLVLILFRPDIKRY